MYHKIFNLFIFWSDWIRFVQNGSKWIKLDQIGDLRKQSLKYIMRFSTLYIFWSDWNRYVQNWSRWIKLDQIGFLIEIEIEIYDQIFNLIDFLIRIAEVFYNVIKQLTVITSKKSSKNLRNDRKQECFWCLQGKKWIKMPICLITETLRQFFWHNNCQLLLDVVKNLDLWIRSVQNGSKWIKLDQIKLYLFFDQIGFLMKQSLRYIIIDVQKLFF